MRNVKLQFERFVKMLLCAILTFCFTTRISIDAQHHSLESLNHDLNPAFVHNISHRTYI